LTTYRDYVAKLIPAFLRRALGAAYTGVVHGLVPDIIMESASQATKVHFVGTQDLPDDALPYVGAQKDIDRYPGESLSSFKTRIRTGIQDHIEGGTDIRVEEDLAVAYADGVVYEDNEWVRPPQPFWTNVWIFFSKEAMLMATGGGAIPAPPQTYGTPGLTYTSYPLANFVYGATNLTPQVVRMLRALVRKWKAARSAPRQFIFEFTGETYGTGHVYGEASLSYGGSQGIAEGT
jgi:hypothetical protein